jgi:hypothetical protein
MNLILIFYLISEFGTHVIVRGLKMTKKLQLPIIRRNIITHVKNVQQNCLILEFWFRILKL